MEVRKIWLPFMHIKMVLTTYRQQCLTEVLWSNILMKQRYQWFENTVTSKLPEIRFNHKPLYNMHTPPPEQLMYLGPWGDCRKFHLDPYSSQGSRPDWGHSPSTVFILLGERTCTDNTDCSYTAKFPNRKKWSILKHGLLSCWFVSCI